MKCIFFLSLVLSLAYAQSEVNWVGPETGGLWNEAANWDSKQVPTKSDEVYIKFANVTINATVPAVCQELNIDTDATLLVMSNLTVIGSINLRTNTSGLVLNASLPSTLQAYYIQYSSVDNPFLFVSGILNIVVFQYYGRIDPGLWNGFQLTSPGIKQFRWIKIKTGSIGTIHIAADSTIQIEHEAELEANIVTQAGVVITSLDASGFFASSNFSVIGSGNLNISVRSYIDNLKIENNATVNIERASVTVNSFNTPYATINVYNGIFNAGRVNVDTFQIFGGTLFANSFELNNLNLTSGTLQVDQQSTFSNFWFSGGSMIGPQAGSVAFQGTNTYLVSDVGKTLDSIVINCKTATMICSSIQTHCNTTFIHRAAINNSSFVYL